MQTTTPQLVTTGYIEARFNLGLYASIDQISFKQIIYFDGDAHISGNLGYDWTIATLTELNGEPDEDGVLIMVNGNLYIDGDLDIGDCQPLLLVLGDVHCQVLISGDEFIHITGDAHIQHVFYGHYNIGSIVVEGTTYVPYVLNFAHHSVIQPAGAVLINCYNDSHDFFTYNYTKEMLEEVMVPVIFDNKKRDFDAWKFIDVVVSGESPFKDV